MKTRNRFHPLILVQSSAGFTVKVVAVHKDCQIKTENIMFCSKNFLEHQRRRKEQ